MMYYITVSGWMLSYFYKFATGTFYHGTESSQCAAVFSQLLASPGEMGLWMAVTVLLGFFICSRGLQNGLEKISKYRG